VRIRARETSPNFDSDTQTITEYNIKTARDTRKSIISFSRLGLWIFFHKTASTRMNTKMGKSTTAAQGIISHFPYTVHIKFLYFIL